MADNLADPSSRGLLPYALITCSLHWEGPNFLRLSESDWPISTFTTILAKDLPEVKPRSVHTLSTQTISSEDSALHRFSTRKKNYYYFIIKINLVIFTVSLIIITRLV